MLRQNLDIAIGRAFRLNRLDALRQFRDVHCLGVYLIRTAPTVEVL